MTKHSSLAHPVGVHCPDCVPNCDTWHSARKRRPPLKRDARPSAKARFKPADPFGPVCTMPKGWSRAGWDETLRIMAWPKGETA